MTNPVPRRERRDYIPFFEERDAAIRRDLKYLAVVALLGLVAGVLYFMTPDLSQASYEDVHTVKELCAYHEKTGVRPVNVSIEDLAFMCS